jgi:hypothetical protein
MSCSQVEAQLFNLTQQFENLVRNVPEKLRPRCRVLSERRDGVTFVQVIATFKITDGESDIHST